MGRWAHVGKAVDGRHAVYWIDELLVREQVSKTIFLQFHVWIHAEMLQWTRPDEA